MGKRVTPQALALQTDAHFMRVHQVSPWVTFSQKISRPQVPPTTTRLTAPFSSQRRTEAPSVLRSKQHSLVLWCPRSMDRRAGTSGCAAKSPPVDVGPADVFVFFALELRMPSPLAVTLARGGPGKACSGGPGIPATLEASFPQTCTQPAPEPRVPLFQHPHRVSQGQRAEGSSGSVAFTGQPEDSRRPRAWPPVPGCPADSPN